MIDIHNDEYWSSHFDITQNDLYRVGERLERAESPQALKDIALRIIRGRLEHGHDLSPAVLQELTGRTSVQLWDPAKEWQMGDIVLVATMRKNRLEREAFLGEIIIAAYEKDNEKRARIRIEELGEEKDFILAAPGSSRALNWHDEVRKTVEKKLESGSINQQAEGVLLKHGERILSQLTETLESDSRFTNLEGKWYLTSKLPSIGKEALMRVHLALVQNQSSSEEELLPVLKEKSTIDTPLLRMAIHTALQQSPERFENIGTPARPQWKARLPEPDHAEVTHYAYDPQTYEILCRPGQRLTQKRAQRLQELNLYAHVVTFAE